MFQQLQSALSAILPGSHLKKLTLPTLSQPVTLLLIDDDFSNERLDDEVVRKLWYDTPYWIFCWAAGLAQARWILNHPEQVQNKVVLDFGTGSGVVAIAAALAGAKKVIACDIDPVSLLATKANAKLNSVELEYLDDFFKLNEKVDILFAADVLYDQANQFFLDEFIKKANEVWVADSRVKNFQHPLFKRTQTVEASTWPDLDESAEFRQVHFYHGQSTG